MTSDHGRLSKRSGMRLQQAVSSWRRFTMMFPAISTFPVPVAPGNMSSRTLQSAAAFNATF